PEDLGRIAALTGKQVLLQKIREAEREVVFAEYTPKVGQIMTGTIASRKPGGVLVISLGKVEGILPRSEQSPMESFNEGDRIKVILAEVNLQPNRVQLLCSRAHPDLVRRLFELEIPEVADGVVEIRAVAREAGHRTKIAVATNDSNVDCVGACVGVKGSRIRNVVDELFGEKIDIVRWNDTIENLIVESLRPAEISSLELDYEGQSANVYVKPDQQSLAIGRRGQNVRLASKLTGWELNITPITEEELEQMRREDMESRAEGLFSDRLAQLQEQEQEAAPSPDDLDRLLTRAAAEHSSALAAGQEFAGAETSSIDTSAFDRALKAAVEAEKADSEGGAMESTATEGLEVLDLEDLPGIGKLTAERLRVAGLDTAAKILAGGEDALATVEGIGEGRARQILEFLRSR
ncbi:MAG: transcription termination factor NusA, partial [Planctomycetes bacterium]|nr:transcription termination factor NusA [Planctomycetota bacterium]